jgi:glutamate--cysteine ligase
VPSLAELSRDLDAHLAALSKVGGALGVDWLREALDPAHSLEAMHWMPKARYGIMREFLGPRGRLAHRMMAQTTSIQCAFDYADALDWRRKFKAAALLAPVATALFANSSRVDGAPSGWRSFRQRIWQETDPARCGMPGVVFEPDFGIEAWLDWVLDVPTIFRHRARGLVPAGGVPFRAMLERSGCDALRMADWETHASTIFTEVRAYTYIEVRSADLQPDELAFAVPALWTGLLYDERALERALALAAPVDDHARWNDAMRAAARDGLEAKAEGGRPMAALAAELLGLALAGLGRGAGGDDGTGRRALEALAAHLSLEPHEPEAAC